MIHYPRLEENEGTNKSPIQPGWTELFIYFCLLHIDLFQLWDLFSQSRAMHVEWGHRPHCPKLCSKGILYTQISLHIFWWKLYWELEYRAILEAWDKVMENCPYCQLRISPKNKNVREKNPWKEKVTDIFSRRTGKRTGKEEFTRIL